LKAGDQLALKDDIHRFGRPHLHDPPSGREPTLGQGKDGAGVTAGCRAVREV